MNFAPESNHAGTQIDSIARQAYEQVPTSDTWGVFSYDDGPPAAGGGTGAFLWFDTRDQMFHFVARCLPLWAAAPCGSDPCEIAAQACQILSANGGTTEMSRQRLNQVLKGYAQIVWWGQFGELMSAETGFAREVRGWFRSVNADGLDDGAIASDKASEFSTALKEYGI